MRRSALLAGLLAACSTPPFDRPPGPPAIERFDAVPFRARPEDRVRIAWRVLRADAVELVAGGMPAVPVPAEGEIERSFEATTALELIARGRGGESRGKIEVVVAPLPAVAVTRFDVTPAVVAPGDPVIVRWETRNAAEVVITASPGGPLERDPPLAGQSVFRPDGDTRFALRAEGPGGPVELVREVKVRLDAPVIESFFVAPPVITPDQQAQATWLVRGADAVTLSLRDARGGDVPLLSSTGPAGSLVLAGATGSAELVLEARSRGGVARETASLRVLDTDPPEILALALSDAVTGPGGQVLARFASRNATQVRVSFGGSQVAVLPGGEGTVTLGAPSAGAYEVEAIAFDARGRQSARAVRTLAIDRRLPEARYFSASPAAFQPGDAVDVVWSFLRADRITLTTDLGEVLTTTTATIGAWVHRPTASQLLTLEAENASGITRRFAALEAR